MKTMADVLELPDAPRRLIKWTLGQGKVTVAGAAEFLGVDPSAARELLEQLRCHGFMESTGAGPDEGYRPRIGARLGARRSSRASDLLGKALGEPPETR